MKLPRSQLDSILFYCWKAFPLSKFTHILINSSLRNSNSLVVYEKYFSHISFFRRAGEKGKKLFKYIWKIKKLTLMILKHWKKFAKLAESYWSKKPWSFSRNLTRLGFYESFTSSKLQVCFERNSRIISFIFCGLCWVCATLYLTCIWNSEIHWKSIRLQISHNFDCVQRMKNWFCRKVLRSVQIWKKSKQKKILSPKIAEICIFVRI